MEISHELKGVTLEEMKEMGASFGIGMAIELMKEERIRVARRGWNGKDMFLAYQAGYPDGIPINKNTAEATGIKEGTVCKFQPYIMMKTADNTFVPWLASQTDLLAEDYYIVE
ncbi:hypothetical protein JIMMER1_101 [Brevibacillus phage Jimmer1]|uniref:Thoeris anti-defense 2-like domain-containing protein n=4 Tax=Jimmervirus TaxID=1984788 RepID=S5MN92_9CAUD|nr:hypothetical protein AVV10_gp101 [Brevibacillus phage Osiris]YP_009226411.1 hypothetical protein AXJ21_gp101 [Brevibacillus phage Jimmer1]YP_009606528.1 hypothetical protein FDI01_gp101 [Brevibacillus phage Jimmer2]ALA48111.1 hypothetical protein POWDER_101 [Brevibacillus phage Powder]AGR47230.1 hypothetical protein JIMMER2_101 [Brevibacillus phage Jimmer2]AGR47329.1 hypothetical protein JIMMER1_101 [Brevibacillus phage Jimmer1]ALA07402.1 hypothetical protein OSIRIS_101 [Brevibacillus phag